MINRMTISSDGKGSVKFQETIEWTVPGLGSVKVEGPECDTPHEALAAAKQHAEIMGWREPKWYEWWRWGDSSYGKVKRIKLTVQKI